LFDNQSKTCILDIFKSLAPFPRIHSTREQLLGHIHGHGRHLVAAADLAHKLAPAGMVRGDHLLASGQDHGFLLRITWRGMLAPAVLAQAVDFLGVGAP
jgi:hypothetical protein